MTPAVVLAGVAAAACCWWLLPGQASVPVPRHRTRPLLPLIGVVALVTVSVVGGAGLQPVLVAGTAGCTAYGGWRLHRVRRARLAAERTATRVLESCEALAGELAAGRPPGAALVAVARDWPALELVVRAHDLGDSVPGAWRRLASLPGAGQLRLVGAAWELSGRTGHGLATALTSVGETLRRDDATRRVVGSELASARATARLMAGLPVVALLMGSGVGGDPWGFLFGTVPGLVCLAGGLVLGMAGLWWIERLAAGVLEGR